MRVRMKNLMGVMEGGSIPALSNLEEALKTEEKVNLLHAVKVLSSKVQVKLQTREFRSLCACTDHKI